MPRPPPQPEKRPPTQLPKSGAVSWRSQDNGPPWRFLCKGFRHRVLVGARVHWMRPGCGVSTTGDLCPTRIRLNASQTRDPMFGVLRCVQAEKAATGRTGRQKRILAGWSSTSAGSTSVTIALWMSKAGNDDARPVNHHPDTFCKPSASRFNRDPPNVRFRPRAVAHRLDSCSPAIASMHHQAIGFPTITLSGEGVGTICSSAKPA